MKKLLLCALLAYFSCGAWAGTATGKITSLLVRDDGLIYFFLDTAPTGSPSCAATHPYWMIRDENSNWGKQQYALLLAAQAAGKTVHITGKNTCTRWFDGEDVSEINLLP